MKKAFTTFFFSAFCLLAFAQPAFNEKSVQDMAARMVADFPNFMREEVTPDFMWTFAEGQVFISQDIAKDMSDAKVTAWDLSDLRVKQIGGMAVATGANQHEVMTLSTKESRRYNVRFTYVYAYVNDKWKWIQGQHTYIQPASKN